MKNLISLIFVIYGLAALGEVIAQGIDNLTATQVRSIQSRQFKTSNLSAATFSVVGALTDFGYTGRMATDKNGEFSRTLNQGGGKYGAHKRCEVFIRYSPDKKFIVIRFAISGDGGVIVDPDEYNQLFSSVSKSLFIDAQQIPYKSVN
jgi:hypothetical protein